MAKSTRTDPQEARERIQESYDGAACDSWYKQLRYAFGETWEDGSSGLGGGSRADDEITDYPDITMRIQEVGRSRRIFSTQLQTLTRVRVAPPVPRYTQVDKFTNMIRQQVIKQRMSGTGQNQAFWGSQLDNAFLYGNGVGQGHIRIGIEKNPATGLDRVDIRNYSPFSVVLDRHDETRQRPGMVSFVDYLSKSEAYKYFGKEVADKYIAARWVTSAGGSETHSGAQTLHAMRVIHYFDLGFGANGTPTHICFPGSIHEKPVKVEDSDWWRFLPHCTYTHFQPPGMRFPVGQIALQMATSEILNVAERYIRSNLITGRGMDFMDDSFIDEADAERWHAGEHISRFRASGIPKDQKVLERVQPMSVDQHSLLLLSHFDRQFNTDSNMTSWEMSNMQGSDRSATENMLLKQSSSGVSWQMRQITSFYIDLFDKIGRAICEYDRDPVMIDVNTHNILLNDAKNMNSWLDNFFTEPSEIQVDYAKNSFDDAQQEMEREMLKLQSIAQIAMGINPPKFVYETLRTAGLAPEEWMPPELLRAALTGTLPMMLPPATPGADQSPAGQVLAPLMGGGTTTPQTGTSPTKPGTGNPSDPRTSLGGGPQPYAS